MAAMIGAAARTVLPYAASGVAAYGAYTTVSSMIGSFIKSLGRSVVESLSTSPYFIMMATGLIFIYAASYLRKKRLLDRKMSAVIVALFVAVMGCSLPVVKHVKRLTFTQERHAAASFAKGEITLDQVERDHRLNNKQAKQAFLVQLIKQGKPEDVVLAKALVSKYNGYLSTSFDKEAVTIACIKYGSLSMFNYLHKQGLLELNKPLELGKDAGGNHEYRTAFELAERYSNGEAIQRICEINKVAQMTVTQRLLRASKRGLTGLKSYLPI